MTKSEQGFFCGGDTPELQTAGKIIFPFFFFHSVQSNAGIVHIVGHNH
jgi:hypothetical protein